MSGLKRKSPTAARQRGFSLVELMIALAAGLIVSGAAIAFLMSSFRSNGEYVISTRLTQELRNTLDLVTRDLRRAGYDQYSMSGMASGRISPFSRMRLCDATNKCVGDVAAPTPPYTCVIYAYDRDTGNHGQLDVDTGEVRAVRRRTATVNGIANVGIIEYGVSAAGVKPVCSAAGPNYAVFPVACNTTTNWCPLSDPTRLDVTSFAITDASTNSGSVRIRDLTVVLQGRPAGKTDYVRGVTANVRIRSDCYDTALTNCTLSP